MKKTILSAIALAAVSLAGAQTVRHLVVTDKEGKEQSFVADEIQGVLFETPEYRDLTHLLRTGYEEKGNSGLYTVEFGTSEPDSEGNPLEIGDIQVALLLMAPKSETLAEPVLPAGYYRVGKSIDEWTFDIGKSVVWSRTAEGSEGIAPTMILDGTVDVRVEENGDYDIRMEFLTLGGPLDMRYQGPLKFGPGYSESTAFTEPVNVDFSIGQARFYGNWFYPFSADMLLQFYEGTVSDGVLTDGYILEIEMYEPRPEDCMDPNQVIADGTYVAENREKINGTYLPFTFRKGENVEFFGSTIPAHTRLEYIAPSGHRKLGLITGGTLTVSENGTKFMIDFVTAEGISIKGTYTKAPVIVNYCDNDVKEPQRPFSTLTEDLTLNWVPGTGAFNYVETEYPILEDLNRISLIVAEPEMTRGDYLMFDLHCDESVVTDGTYTVDWTLGNKNIIPGAVDFAGVPVYAWYGDLDTTGPDGTQSTLGPIASGTVTISTLGDGNRKIVFDLTDDAGNKITGEYTGPITDISEQPEQVRKMKKAADRSMRKALPRRAR